MNCRTWYYPNAPASRAKRPEASKILCSRSEMLTSSCANSSAGPMCRAIPSGLVFPDETTGQPFSENRFLNARSDIGYEERCTPHGFRSSFRDWVAEETNFPPEVAEMALAHAIKNKVEAAYRRGDLIKKRRASSPRIFGRRLCVARG